MGPFCAACFPEGLLPVGTTWWSPLPAWQIQAAASSFQFSKGHRKEQKGGGHLAALPKRGFARIHGFMRFWKGPPVCVHGGHFPLGVTVKVHSQLGMTRVSCLSGLL